MQKRVAEALGNGLDDRSWATLHKLQAHPNPQVAEAARLSLQRLAELP